MESTLNQDVHTHAHAYLANAERLKHAAEGHERGGRLLKHVAPVDTNVLFAVGPLVCVPEAERVTGLVRHHILLKSARAQFTYSKKQN